MNALIDPIKVLNELRHTDENDLKTFQSLLNHSTKIFVGSWEPVLLKLFEIITSNKLIRGQQSLLASHAFFTVWAETLPDIDINSQIREILKLERSEISLLNQTFTIFDLECFKLTIIHGYLLVNSKIIFSRENFIFSFEIIQRYCINYTRYAYFAFKLLDIWLKKSINLKFWNKNDDEIEKKLETVIFSNWDNCISDIAKINAHQLFPIYLIIMEEKYNGYLEYAFQICKKNLSWQSTTKFIILSVICKVWNGYPEFNNWEIKIITQSLTKSQLKHASTKLYLALLTKMSEIEWSEFFMSSLCLISKVWEQEKNTSALQLLWDLWMRPTLYKFNNQGAIISTLWFKFCHDEMIICQSYLAKISAELGISWNHLNSLLDKENGTKLNYWEIDTKSGLLLSAIDAHECVRLNTIAYYCNANQVKINYEVIKQFFYYNANANSIKLRKGIFDNFKILLDRISRSPWTEESSDFILWQHTFILNCFEPGSCYQRKIIGLRLYEIILTITNKKLINKTSVKQLMQDAGKWKLDDENSLFTLLRLCLDPIEELRQVASRIITNYFNMTILSTQEISAITLKVIEMNKSWKFYEIAAGVKLLLLISQVPNDKNLFYHNNPQNLYKYLLQNAKDSLDLIKKNLLKALTQDSNFNASLIAILQLASQQNSFLNVSNDYITRLLNLLEEATIFFLSALSPKSSNTSYSSSFAEMAVAIEEIIKNSATIQKSNNAIISPAHQVIISSVWMTLKTISELSAKISILPLKFDDTSRSLDLIVSILMKCRHKGAIEAAGYALGESMRYLTHKNEFNHLFDSYLNKLLNLDSKYKINTTRRGAGLSIMFLKMMVNDKKRRIVHIALRKILNSLHDPEEKESSIDASQDSSRARLLHYLRSVVADKSLLEDLVSDMEEISLISIHHLQSSEWAVRNASLQLLGAVIPRIVGQTGENELEFGTGYLINHFVTHYPTLAKLVLEKLDHNSDFKTTNILVPLLTLLSKMSVGGCDFTDYSSKEYICKLKKRLYSLFGHPVEHVRFLAAKAFAALIPINSLTAELFDLNREHVEGNNYIHGNLLAQISIQHKAKYSEIWVSEKSVNNYYSEIAKEFIFKSKLNKSYFLFDYWNNKYKKPLNNVIETTFLQSIINFTTLGFEENFHNFSFITKPYYLQTLIENGTMSNKIGFSELINQLVKFCCLVVNTDTSEYLEYIFSNFLLKYKRCEDVENYFLKHLNQSFKISNDGRDRLISKLLIDSFNNSNNNQIIDNLKIIIGILRHDEDYRQTVWDNNNNLGNEISSLSKYLLEKFKCRKIHQLAHMLTVLGFCNHCELYSRLIDDIVCAVHDPNKQERIWAIDCLMNLNLLNLKHQLKQRVLESLIILSSDENEEIRTLLREKILERCRELWKITNHFVHNCNMSNELDLDLKTQKLDRSRNSEFHFHKVIEATIICHSFCLSRSCGFQCILNFIDNIIKNNKKVNENGLERPFDHDETFSENTKFMNIYYHLMFNTLKGTLEKSTSDSIDYNGIIQTGNRFYKDYVMLIANENYSLNIATVLDIKVDDYLKYKRKCMHNLIVDSVGIN